MREADELGLWLEALLSDEEIEEIGGELIYTLDESVKLLYDEATFSPRVTLPTVRTLRLQSPVKKNEESC
jgi:hypothetical protein